MSDDMALTLHIPGAGILQILPVCDSHPEIQPLDPELPLGQASPQTGRVVYQCPLCGMRVWVTFAFIGEE